MNNPGVPDENAHRVDEGLGFSVIELYHSYSTSSLLRMVRPDHLVEVSNGLLVGP